jgi:hypothetical protein
MRRTGEIEINKIKIATAAKKTCVKSVMTTKLAPQRLLAAYKSHSS